MRPRPGPRRVASTLVGSLAIVWVMAPPAGAQTASPGAASGPVVTIHAPSPRQLVVVLDEVQLDWSRVPRARALAPATGAVAAPGTRIVAVDAVRARVSVAPAADLSSLRAAVAALKAANPGADVYLVVYPENLPKTASHRQLLTHEVAVMAASEAALRSALPGGGARGVKPAAGVPGGFVVEADDPVAALDLAETLRRQPDIQAAYPLVKRQLRRQ
jgi:hypothetical protein